MGCPIGSFFSLSSLFPLCQAPRSPRTCHKIHKPMKNKRSFFCKIEIAALNLAPPELFFSVKKNKLLIYKNLDKIEQNGTRQPIDFILLFYMFYMFYKINRKVL